MHYLFAYIVYVACFIYLHTFTNNCHDHGCDESEIYVHTGSFFNVSILYMLLSHRELNTPSNDLLIGCGN